MVICWNCQSSDLIYCPDPCMNNLTDVLQCQSCGEIQDDETIARWFSENPARQGLTDSQQSERLISHHLPRRDMKASFEITPPVERSVEFTLTLSEEEAMAIYSLVGAVGGLSAQREVTNGIYEKLGDVLHQSDVHPAYESVMPDNKWHVSKCRNAGARVVFTNPEPDSKGRYSGPDLRINYVPEED